MSYRLLNILGGVAALSIAVSTVPAQAPGRRAPAQPKAEKAEAPVPRAFRPPSGMCRLWLDNVPADRQPAPTDCPTAIRNRPPNAHVIFGEESNRKAKAKNDDKADDRRKKPPEP